MTTPHSGKQAVILSGGGANGAYEVGVMKALFAGLSRTTNFQPLNPDMFTGTSVGSYNAAFLVAQWETYGPTAIANLEQVWLDKVSDSAQKCGNGVFRIRGTPREFVNPLCFIPNPLRPFLQLATDSVVLAWDGFQRVVNVALEQEVPLLQRFTELINFASFVSLQPFIQTVQETIQFADIRRAKKELWIATTNWETGDLQHYTNVEMTDQLGPLMIMASAAIPGFFPPVKVGSQAFVDGGVVMNTPLRKAIDEGADTLHVIYLDPQVKNIPLSGLENILETMYRMQVIGWAKALNNDIAAARHTNQEVAYAKLIVGARHTLQQSGRDDSLFRGLPEDFETLLAQSLKRKELTIHRYHPQDDLGGALGLLNFDRDRIQHLIERGFNDAIEGKDYEVLRPFRVSAFP